MDILNTLRQRYENNLLFKRWRDLINEFPEYRETLTKCHLLTTADPAYLANWHDLQMAFPDVPGLDRLANLGTEDPEFATLMDTIFAREWPEEFSFLNNLEIIRGSPCLENAQVWLLVEIMERRPYITPASLLQACVDMGQVVTNDISSAVQDPIVIEFCQALRNEYGLE